MSERRSLYLVDGSSYIYRAYHAIKGLSTSEGLPTNAIFGFVRMLMKILKEDRPDYVAMVFDPKGPTFRDDLYPDYKADRPPTPDDLQQQIPYIFRLVEALNLPVIQVDGFEADDVIGTLARKGEEDELDVTIVSGDKDLLQLVTDRVRMLDTMRERSYGPKEVEERFGVPPDLVTEVMGLMGDKIDNVPGVPGIGKKTAAQLIREFGCIENLLENLDRVSKKRVVENLSAHADDARLSKELCTLKTDVPLELKFEELRVRPCKREELRTLLRELEFVSMIRELALDTEVEDGGHQIIHTREELRNLLKRLEGSGGFALNMMISLGSAGGEGIEGMAISVRTGEASFIPVTDSGDAEAAHLTCRSVIEEMKPLLESEEVPKFGHDLKREVKVLSALEVASKGMAFDTMIASYLLNPSRPSHNLDDLALERLNRKLPSSKSGTKDAQNGEGVERMAEYGCSRVGAILRLKEILEPELREKGLEELYREVELPLMHILAEMEAAGIKVDVRLLKEMSSSMDRRLQSLAGEIYDLAGVEFNINSPRQLGDILFNKLNLEPVKKTKTGYSTDVTVLETLAERHPLPALVLDYRQMSKLKSTYVDALPEMVDARTGRIHASFNQTVTATGRLSSSDPNLQNIPIRTEEGREIRKAFIPEEGHIFLSADYSQIELRVLAHLSGDHMLTESFQKGEDIHTRTAVEVFGVGHDKVTPEMRRMAKAVNFGIIYGLSPYGLARDLKVDQKEAKAYIDHYFQRYSGVREYIDSALSKAREEGFVTTILKRRRYLPDIRSRNHNLRQFAERAAINTPVQGSAADIIKMAMINISRHLKEEGLKARMVLQVHDELLFEVPDKEMEQVIRLVKRDMEGVMELKVPIKVSIHSGNNWNEAH